MSLIENRVSKFASTTARHCPRATFIRRSAVVLSALVVASAQLAYAANGTWVQDSASPQNWSNPSNWIPGVADGAGSIADFSTLNIANNNTVVLDSSRSIGELLFQDATTSSNTWTLSNSGGAVLTLDSAGNSFETGSTQPRINVLNQTATLSGVLAGTNGFLATGGNSTLQLSGANTGLSGVVTIHSSSGTGSQFTLRLSNSQALGSATVFSDPGGSNNAHIVLDSGVNIPNNITINTERTLSGGNGTLTTNGDVSATFSGTITINGPDVSGGDFNGPSEGAFNATGQYLTFTGPINLTLPSTAQGLAGGAGNSVVQRGGNVRYSGGGSYFRLEMRSGATQLGANNGLATNSYLDIGGNSNGNPQSYAVFDLAGFNQQLVGISNYVTNTFAATVTNSSTTTPATLTLTPGLGNDPNQANLVFTSGNTGSGTNAAITDTSASAPLSLTVGHVTAGVPDANGTQYILSSNSSYRGVTTLLSGTLAISTLANGGSNSSIGASSNAAGNLVFSGGTLQYVNSYLNSGSNTTFTIANSTTPSTDRNFTITSGSSGTINVASAGTTLTWSGGSANTTGVLNKAGQGTLILTGANQHTGGTTVTGGTLLVVSPGSLSTGNVSISSLATVGGNGTIGGTVAPLSGGIVAPGNPAANSGVGTMTVGGLTLSSGSVTNFEFGTGNDQITVTGAGGLVANGGNINLFNAGTTTAFSTNGAYTLMNINGGVGGALSNLTVTNPTAGKVYTLSSTTSAVQITIANASTAEWTNASSDGKWTTAATPTGSNWVDPNNSNALVAFPNGVGVTAKFGTMAGGGTVDMNGSKTISGLIFDNGSGYTISGTGTLTLNNGAAASAVSVNNGSHTIAVPVSLAKASSIAFLNNSGLTISGAVSGGQPINASGAGTLTLTGNNNYSTTSITGSTVNVGTFGGADTSGTLGAGDVTLSSAGVLNFNRSNAYSFTGNINGSGVGAGSINQLGTGSTTIGGAISNVTSVNVAAGSLTTSSTVNQSGGVIVTGNGGLGNTGTGSLTANGSISGAGPLSVDTSGTVNLNASNSYTGDTTINNGTVALGAVGAFPSNGALTINGDGSTHGGILDLHGQNISLSNITGNQIGGVITNNGSSSSTSTVTLNGASANYDMFAALNNGSSGGKVALVTGITNTASGNVFILHLHSPGTYTGGTTVNSQSIEADASNAFGTGPITITANNASTNSSQILLAPGVTIGNAITVQQGNPHPVNGTTAQGVIQQTAAGSDTTVTGTITILANNANDGLLNGPTTGSGNFLNVQGAVNTSGTANTIVQIGGEVKYSGGGSYPLMQINGLAQLGANNGLAQNAVLQLSAAPVSGQGASAGTFDLGGFDQTAIALLATSGTLASTVQNSGAGTNTLILNTTGTNNYNGAINGNINLTVGGTGTQQLTGTGSSYTGVTTITGSAVLETTSVATVGSNSSIGAPATNDPSLLVFDGGTLRYVGIDSTPNTDRGFTINNGKTAIIDVANATTNLTLNGSSVGGGGTSGGLTKAGLGTLTLGAGSTHAYTGPTTVSKGILLVNTTLSNTSSVSIASGAILGGSGSVGGTVNHNQVGAIINPGAVGGTSAGTLTFTGPLTLNGGTVQYDVDGATARHSIGPGFGEGTGRLEHRGFDAD